MAYASFGVLGRVGGGVAYGSFGVLGSVSCVEGWGCSLWMLIWFKLNVSLLPIFFSLLYTV